MTTEELLEITVFPKSFPKRRTWTLEDPKTWEEDESDLKRNDEKLSNDIP